MADQKLERLSWQTYGQNGSTEQFFDKNWYTLFAVCSNFVCRETLHVGLTGRLVDLDGETGYQRLIATTATLDDENRLQTISDTGFGPAQTNLEISFKPVSEFKADFDEGDLLGLGDPEEVDLEEFDDFVIDAGYVYPGSAENDGDPVTADPSFFCELALPDALFEKLWARVYDGKPVEVAYLCIAIHAFQPRGGEVDSLSQNRTFGLEYGLNLACTNFLRLDKSTPAGS